MADLTAREEGLAESIPSTINTINSDLAQALSNLQSIALDLQRSASADPALGNNAVALQSIAGALQKHTLHLREMIDPLRSVLRPERFYQAGVVAAADKQFERAAGFFRRALELRTEYPEAHKALGDVLSKLGKLEDAVVCYERALALKPDFAEAHNNLGNVLQTQGKLEDAAGPSGGDLCEGASGCELGRYFPDAAGPQAQSQVAVVMATILRPSLETALRSVYVQEGVGRIQILIGIDKPGDPTALYRVLEARPANVSALVLTLPYSTSVRHGGPHIAMDGSALRAILSFMANTRYVAYLDDDNTWLPNHLKNLLAAVEGKVWAFSRRILVDQETGRDLAVDRWDSVGANKGRLAATGGLVDPNCLLINKVAAASVLGRWSETPDGRPSDTADRHFFAAIRNADHGAVEEATVRYSIPRTHILHKIMAEGIEYYSEVGN